MLEHKVVLDFFSQRQLSTVTLVQCGDSGHRPREIVGNHARRLHQNAGSQVSWGGPRNLLSQTRFPLGLPPGWNLDAQWGDDRGDEDEPHVASDKRVMGPSGSPALHLQGPRAFILSSAAFIPVLPHRQHVASVFMRGRGIGHWSVHGGDKELARKTIALDNTDWQRQELAFTPDLTAKTHTLRFQSESGFAL